MKSFWIITFSLIICVVFLGMYCCNIPENTNTSKAQISFNGKEASNYMNYCAGCHGRGFEKFMDRDWMFANTPEEIAQLIKDGEPDMGMPSFKETFTNEEIKKLTNFIIEKSKQHKIADESDRFSKEDADVNNTNFWAQTIISDLDSPWGLEFLPNGDLLIAERNGRLSRLNSDNKRITINGLPPIRVGGQGGLMDLQLHPKYAENGWIYISYSYFDKANDKAGNTAIIRATLSGDKLVNIETIYEGKPTLTTKHHYGCRIEFDGEGYLYFSIGDRGRRDQFPQKLDNSNGKVHRLFDDGSVPPDNPFVGKAGAVESIYSFGHRNVQGIAVHPITGDVWTHEHGPKGGDEINIIKKGENYGWPVISYGINYSGTKFTDITEKEGMLQPLIYYVPSIAPCGMDFVTSNKYEGWENNLLIGSLSFEYLERCVIKDNKIVEQEKLLEGIGRVRNVRVSPDGYIYVAIEEPGKILKLIPVDQ